MGSPLNTLLGLGTPNLPTLPEDGWCAGPVSPLLSQIKAVLILPIGLSGPTDWTSSSDIEGLTDNATGGNDTGKWLVGFGEVQRPEAIRITLGRNKEIITRRRYSLLLNLTLSCEGDYNMVLALQKNWTGFRFWFYTVGGRLIGGANGILPSLVNPSVIYAGQRNSVERGEIVFEWSADGDPMRSYVPGIFGNEVAPSSSQFQVNVYRQSFPNQIGATLTWTQNGGEILAPYANNVWVFQNGQKLNQELGQYTVTPGSGSATIEINGLAHWDGSNYEVYSFETAE